MSGLYASSNFGTVALNNFKKVLFVGVAIVAVTAVYVLINHINENRQEDARVKLYKAMNLIDDQGAEVSDEAVIKSLETVIPELGTTHASVDARYQLAEKYYKTKNYDKAISFGAHPSVATDFRLAITDSTSGSPVVSTHTGTYNWSRYSHQKWAFVVFNDGSQKCRFFANGTFLGETVITTPLTEDNFTKFVVPSAAIHRRIETLAEALSDSAAVAATAI